ncbi:hypothetical protein ACMHYB_46750 [Sorangium sp. So ce1128]
MTPTYTPDLVNAALDLLTDGERGLWHRASPWMTDIPGRPSGEDGSRVREGLYLSIAKHQ